MRWLRLAAMPAAGTFSVSASGAAAALASLIALGPSPAAAYSVDVDATVIGQGASYNTADAAAQSVLRRRLTSYLGLYLGGIGRMDRDGRPAVRDQFSVTIQLRVDSDFGDFLCNIGRGSVGSPLGCLDASSSSGSVRTDPELSNTRPELLLAYAEGKNLGGWVDVRIGRQILWDLHDMRGFDGGFLSVRTPLYVALEAFGGVSQTGALSIDSPLYVLDGTSRSLRYAPDDPRQQFAALQPTVGASLRTSGLRDFSGLLSYRRTFSATQDLAAPGCLQASGELSLCAPSSGIIEERVSYSLHGRLLGGRLHATGGLRYDLLNGRFDDGELGVSGTPARGHNIGVEYRYSAPTFDGDAIWNVFSTEPYHQVQAAYDGRQSADRNRGGSFNWHIRGFARLYRQSDAPNQPTGSGAISPTIGGDAEVRYQRARGFVRAGGYCDGGYGGLRAGADLSGRYLLLRDTIGLEGRVLYYYFADDQRDASQSHGVSLQAGARWAIIRGALLHLLAEENIDRFYTSQLRLLAMLDLSFLLGPRGGGRAPAGLVNAGFGGFPAPGLMPGILP